MPSGSSSLALCESVNDANNRACVCERGGFEERATDGSLKGRVCVCVYMDDIPGGVRVCGRGVGGIVDVALLDEGRLIGWLTGSRVENGRIWEKRRDFCLRQQNADREIHC
jgi:hypothetical protein